MKVYLWLILFVIVLIAPFVLRLTMGPSDDPPPVGRAELRLVVITPHNADIRREFARAFDDWHRQRFGQGVSIDYRTPGGTVDIKRLLENTYKGYLQEDGFSTALVPPADIVWGGGDFFFDQELKKLIESPGGGRRSVLQPIAVDPKIIAEAFPQTQLAGVRLYDHNTDAPPQWVGVCLSSFGIVYNPDLYEALDLSPPQTWRDLTHERLSGLVALADPTRSGSAAVAYMVVIQRAMADAEEEYFQSHASIDKNDPQYRQAIEQGWKRGMRELLLIAANARYFTDSASQVPNDVAHGEAAAGMAIDFYGRVVEESVGDRRLKFISPVAATAITPDPIGILYGVSGPRLELANRFIEFLLTRHAQLLWILNPNQPGGPRERALRRPPVRRDVYNNRTGWADDVNPFEEAGGFNQRGAWMGLFADTRIIWAAAWIDSREALKDSYSAILRIEDAERRARLIADLSDLPIEMKDVAHYRAERERIEKEQGDVEQFKARQRIEWAVKFRAHYDAVAEKAQ